MNPDASLRIIIPARLASSRLPEKLLQEVEGTPLIVLTAQQVAKANPTALVIATDSPRILEVTTSAGFETILTRPSHPSGTDRLAEVVERLDWPDETIVVNVQGDEPLIDPNIIHQLHSTLLARPDCAVATCAYKISSAEAIFNPNIVKVVFNRHFEALYFSRASIPFARDEWQQNNSNHSDPVLLPPHQDYYHHIGIYAYRVKSLKQFPTWPVAPIEQTEKLEQLRFMWQGQKILIVPVREAPMAGVDTFEDLERVRKLVAMKKQI